MAVIYLCCDGRLEIVVEFCSCCVMVRFNVNKKDAGSKDGKNVPTDEAEIEKEEIQLVAVHHLAAFGDRVIAAEIGVVDEDVICHRVGIALDDTGNQKEQAPKECEDHGQKIRNEYRAKIFERIEKVFESHCLCANDREECRAKTIGYETGEETADTGGGKHTVDEYGNEEYADRNTPITGKRCLTFFFDLRNRHR